MLLLAASPGADTFVGAGAFAYPAVVVVLLVLGIVAAAARNELAAVVAAAAGVLASVSAVDDLMGRSSGFDGYLVAWIVTGAFAIACGGYGLHQTRQRKRMLDLS